MKRSAKQLLRRFLSSRLRPHRIVGGPLRGAWLVTSWHDYPAGITGRTERPLIDWFVANVSPGDTWLDVGAHYGYTAIALSRLVGPSGRVFAFEPVVSTAGCATQTRQLNGLTQLTVVPCGLASPESVAYVSLPLERGMADRTMNGDEGRLRESIQIARLDWLWPRLNGVMNRVDGVKIDVQGMEIEALQGMADVLERHHPKVVIELHAGVDRSVILNLLAGLNYRTRGRAIEPQRGDEYIDDRSYVFVPGD
jgi:FkbM family methyltransferase